MAAFDKILSGIAGMDEALDFIRLGDNVVFQVSDLEEYFFFARSFAAQALKDGKKLIYIRFAQHEAVLEQMCIRDRVIYRVNEKSLDLALTLRFMIIIQDF